jgi:hypothetical protein
MLDWLENLAELNLFYFGLALLVFLVVAYEVGYRASHSIVQKGWVKSEKTMGSAIIVGGMMTLLAFVLGVSLSIAFSGFQKRQNAIVEEAKAIQSAWFIAGGQADDDAGISIRRQLADYAGIRLSAATSGKSPEEKDSIADQTQTAQKEIWRNVDQLEQQSTNRTSTSLIPKLTEAFGGAVEQRQAFDMRVPRHIGRFLAITAFLAMLSIGTHLGMHGNRLTVMPGILIVTVTIAIATISDLSRPYHGNINATPAALQMVVDVLGTKE